MKIIQASIMGGENMPFLSFQFGISVQAESLLIGNLDWEEMPIVGPDGEPMPDWEAQQFREKHGGGPEKTTVSIPVMIALMSNMPASAENYAKAKGSAFDTVREVILGALRVAEKYEHLTIKMISIPMLDPETTEEQPFEES
jgi:hypothetical protein